MKKSIKFLPLLATGLLAVGCQDYDAGFSEADIKTKQYADKFVQEFGQVDPNQDWSMATLVEANVNLPELQGTAKMNIMTGDPRLASTRLLAQIMLQDGQGQIKFDAIKGQDNVFVTVEQDGQYKVFGQYAIENGMLTVRGNEAAKGNTRAADDVCNAELDGDPIAIGITYNPLSDPSATNKINVQYISGVETKAAEPWVRGEGYALYGEGGFFEEYLYYYGPKGGKDKTAIYGSTAEEKKAVIETLEKDFMITSTGGEISVPFVYGATGISDQFGYVIYDEGQDPLTQPHYILMLDGTPSSNVFIDTWQTGTTYGGTTMYDQFIKGLESAAANKDTEYCYCRPGKGIWSQPYGTGPTEMPDDYVHESWCNLPNGWGDGTCNCWEDSEGSGIYSSSMEHASGCTHHMQDYIDTYNTRVYGTEYRLMYLDPTTKQFTYDIPAGKKIVFFICPTSVSEKVSTSYSSLDFNYSMPSLNKRINHLYGNTDSPTFVEGNNVSGHANARGAVKASAWKYANEIYLGFEDGGRDEDLNDIVYKIKGAFTTDNLFSLYSVKWHLNYEGKHDTNDLDLFYSKSYQATGDETYTQAPGFPTKTGATFLGWATSPNGEPIEGSDKDDTVITGKVTGNICYFAIWSDTEVVPDPEYITWMFACEDLGSDFDYDFNDVVWEVRHEVGTSKLEARILAAGGTLPFALQYNGESVKTKEQAFGTGCNGTVMIKPTPTEWFTVSESVADDWSVTTNASEFSVLVSQEDGSVVSEIKYAYSKDDEDATNNNKTPQVIIVPYDWRWPKETHKISLAYPGFTTWAADATWAQWSANIDEEHVVTR